MTLPPAARPERRLAVASRWALAAAVALTVGVLVGSLLPRVPMPPGPFGDKWMHAAGYAALAFCWRRAVQGPTSTSVLLAVAAFGAAVEGLQGLTPSRSFEWADMLANAAGATIGLWASGGALRAWRDRRGRRDRRDHPPGPDPR